jgi:DNA-3-methyladenine glycosylase II
VAPRTAKAAVTPPRALTRAALEAGVRRLAQSDPDLAAVAARLGVPPLWGRRPGFETLVRIVLEQQVSLAAAQSLHRRLRARVGAVTPGTIHALGEDGMRQTGFTRQKARYCAGLAQRLRDGRLDLAALARGPDAEGRRALLAVPGLGPWSVDIYYLMALRRPDVWPAGDLALASALREVKRLERLPDRPTQEALTQAWSPWRAVAARLLWAHYLDARGRRRPRRLAAATP